MALSERQLLDSLSRTPFVDSAELALILGEPHATVHRTLADLLADGIAGRVSHGTAHLPSSQRYHLTANGIRQATGVLGFETASDFVRAYPVSREWLTLLIRRMDAVASIYRLAASMSPGIDGLRSRVEFHRRGRFDATITLHDGRSVGVGNHDWERNEKGQRTEAIERPTGDGVHRRAAGDAAARSAHPGPDDRSRPPTASGGPVHSRAQAANGGGGRGLSGSRNHLPPLPVFLFHFPHFVAAAPPSTPQTAMFHLPHFVAETAP